MNKHISFLLLVFLFLLLACNNKKRSIGQEDENEKADTLSYQYQYGIRADTLDMIEYQIEKGDNLSTIFSRIGFSMSKVDSVVRSSKDILDPKKLQAGRKYITLVTQDTLADIRYIIFEKSNVDFSVIDLTQDSIVAYEFNKEITIKSHYTEGVIKSNLWNTIVENDGDPLLSLKLSDVFAWQIDFYDVKEGDSFKVIYDIAYVDDTIPLQIQDITTAVFTHQEKEYYAIPFEQDSILEFFDEEGQSLRKAFLKAPLNFQRISSRFSNARFHPVLKKYRAHHGVDYAAPTGTPVRTIGDGTVVAKAFQRGGAGYYLKIKHNSVYTTTYMHLSRFAKGIEVGKRVKQGETIGYVGSTGLSTGPHLDFRVHKNGNPIDPLKMESPPSHPVKAELMDSFRQVVQLTLDDLNKRSEDFKTRISKE